MIWETGEDLYVREPGQPGGTGTSKLFDDEIARRPRLHQRRRQGARRRQAGAAGRVGPVPVQPAAAPAGPVLQVQPTRADAATTILRARTGQLRRGLQRLPAVLARRVAADHRGGHDPTRPPRCRSRRPAARYGMRVHRQRRRLREEPGQRLLVPDDVEHPAQAATTRSSPASRRSSSTGPPRFDPPTGTQYAYSQAAEPELQAADADRRPHRQDERRADVQGLLRHRARTGTSSFVEAHTVGQDDWTTLPDVNGHTRRRHRWEPQLPRHPDHGPAPVHRALRDAQRRAATRAPTPARPVRGTRPPATRAAFQALERRPQRRTRASRWRSRSPTSATRARRASACSSTTPRSRPTAPRSARRPSRATSARGPSPARRPAVPATRTTGSPVRRWATSTARAWRPTDTLLWGFGLEGVTGAQTRATVVKDALTYLGAAG